MSDDFDFDNEDYEIEVEFCYDLILINVGENLTEVIALIRELNHQTLGIQEIKEMIEKSPVTIAECLAFQEPSIWKKRFETIGAKTEFYMH
jgi:ribosomal protein L7/L12